jgi:hypothetical protein
MKEKCAFLYRYVVFDFTTERSVVDPDRIQIQCLCGSGSGLSKNAGSGLKSMESTTLPVSTGTSIFITGNQLDLPFLFAYTKIYTVSFCSAVSIITYTGSIPVPVIGETCF